MAIRNIIKVGDSVLTTPCKKVDTIDARTLQLLGDMHDTLAEAGGVGLAAPQMGVLKRIAIIDMGEDGGLFELINPEILEMRGSQIDSEGCLSFPGKFGEVERPNYVKVRAINRGGESVILEGEGLFARAVCHEVDHLDGKMFMGLVRKWLEE